MTEQALVNSENVTAMQSQQAPQGIAPMVQMVASGQITIEQLDHLMGLQERHEAGEAKRQYNVAMAKFRAEVPAAMRDGQGQNNTYATLGSVMSAINGPLGNNGFNVDFRHTQQVEKNLLTVTCTITHSGGHSESTSLTITVDKLGSANAVQSLGGNVSYLKRYCVTSLTGLATEDYDGENPPQMPDKKQKTAPGKPAFKPAYTKEQYDAFHNAIDDEDGFSLITQTAEMEDAAKAGLFNSFAAGKIVSGKETVRKLVADAHATIKASHTELVNRFAAEDESGAIEILAETDWKFIKPHADEELTQWIESLETEQ